jgi:hypothetical protein
MLVLGPLLELWLILRNRQQNYQGTQFPYLGLKGYHLFAKLADLLLDLIHFRF